MSFFNEAMFSPSRSPTIYSSPIASPTPTVFTSYDDFPAKDSYRAKDSMVSLPSVEADNDDRRNVIVIRNGKKSYGRGKNRKEILKDINMTVKEGAIYGLLGASGCGKTTLLSCLVGLKNLDKNEEGKLLVFGGQPNVDPSVGIPGRRVGYMPQEYALFGEFTVRETLQYFGRIYQMSSEEIKMQTKFLIKLLDLPSEKSRAIRNFSGGQQRRVSFAATLLHTPELLILDEPTVGVDPMLRQSIWKYLMSLSSGARKTTILITTHYIEEARQASDVAMMRNGRLLAEAPPNTLLKQFGVSSLEDVFLRLCFVDNQARSDSNVDEKKSGSNLAGENPSERKLNGVTIGGPSSTADIENEFRTSKSGFLGHLPRLKKKRLSFTTVAAANADNLSEVPKFVDDDIKAELIKENPETLVKKNDVSKDEKQRNLEELARKTRDSWAVDTAVGDFSSYCLSSMYRLWALIMKNLIKMRRNISLMAFIFLLPAVQVVFFCLAIGRDPYDLVLGIVNDEAPYSNLSVMIDHDHELREAMFGVDPWAHHHINESRTWPPRSFINETYFEKYCPVNEVCEFTGLSCRYLRELSNFTKERTLILQTFSTVDAAQAAVLDGKAWGFVHFDANFSLALFDRMANSLTSDAKARNQSKLEVRLDMTNQQINYVIYRSLMNAYDKFVTKILVTCDLDPELAKLPLSIGDPIYGTMEPNFTEFMAPGIIILINFFLAVALTGETFITEKRDGLLDRSHVAGVRSPEILVGAIFTQFIVLSGQILITLVFILAVFGIPCNGPLGWVILLTLLQGCVGMCLGFFLSIVCTSEPAAMQATIGSFYPILLLSGILWPVEGMPYFFQAITWYLPCTAACQAMRDVMSRGWGAEGRFSVQLGLLASSAWIAIFMFLSIIMIKIQKNLS